ncbi:hypothetical protein [Paenimyroides baculatum]|uniref:Uncharacterized protein n=1 Tax=Paenimyroides baculatum TaxID=2608000 RepID=A0A5M6CLW2_9FLAO|nr:hypothetical protein [Paenimyroides baculatum]KAA5534305.1 hypothetical protein F0460_09360 [Paenimyroides baculatum]
MYQTPPDVDSTGQEYPIYAGTDKQYKLQHLPIKKNDLGIYYNFLFTADRTHSSSLIEYYDYVEEEKTANECAYDFQICFINRFGAFEYFPLYGKVVQSTAMSKTHYNSVVPNYGYLRLINYKPELTQKSENKYSWSSSQLDEMFYLKIEEINHSPLLFMYNCDTRKIEQVYISSNNYMQKTFKNDKNKQTYNIEFTSVHNKKK